ncbi:MAG: metal-dependent hydrolase, partial [Candidatus Acidiferrum sp.]
LLLPVWALLLAALTRWIVRRRKWDAPSFAALTGIYAVGLLSHILMDLITSFGTMAWSPLKWSRPAWDLIFIVDFTFAGILLVPQIVAWVHERPEKSRRRALVSLAIFILAVFAVQAIGNFVGAPISSSTVFLFDVMLAALFLIPLLNNKNSSGRTQKKTKRLDFDENNSVSENDSGTPQTNLYRRWNRAGLVCGCAYIAVAVLAHHFALVRVKNFATLQKLEVTSMGALPFPPSLWRWDGLVRTPRGVYELRMDLSEKSPYESRAANPAEQVPLEYRFYPEAYPNVFIEAAKELPAVQKVLWFDRFPVTRFHQEGGDAVVEFCDMRFPQTRRGHAAPFTYRVRLGPGGNVLEQGWEK